jgi:FkbM family methyltransferase
VSGKYGRYLLRHPDLIGDAIMRGEFWDQYLKDVIEQNGDPHGLAIDAGAYIGLHTIHLSRHFRQVYAFEPQTQIYRMLSANILLNERQNVLAFNKALYDRPGLMQIASPGKQEIPVPRTHGYVDYHLVKNAAAISFETVEGEVESAVPAITIDSLKLDRVSFIKVDTQGSDLRVLQGAEQTIVRCRPTIVFEFERELTKFHGNELSDYEGYFESIGYELTVVSNRGNGKQIDYLARPR